MKRSLLLMTAAALLVGGGAAWSSQGKGDALDHVSGGGTFGPGCFDGTVPLCFSNRRDLSIDAHGGPDGQNPTGVLYYGRNEPNTAPAAARDVLCMRVDGDVAVLGGTYLEPTAQGSQLVGWAIRLEDNGPPGPGPRDRSTALLIDPLDAVGWPAGFPDTCPAFAFFDAVGYQPLHSGDVVVHDGNA